MMIRQARSVFPVIAITLAMGALATAALAAFAPTVCRAQDAGAAIEAPTLFSLKASAGYGLGRSRQLYSSTKSDDLWWSTGQGPKLDLALDLPLIPVDVVDSAGSTSGTVPVVGLELEASTGYHLSSGGSTGDPLGGGVTLSTTRTATFVPVLLGLNVRTNFGGGLPSVYIGAGGGIYLVGIYEEDVSSSDGAASFTRRMHPPLPFALYGSLGFEEPLMYDADAGNSMLDLFAEFRLTEMSVYVYDYDIYPNGSGAGPVLTKPGNDPYLVSQTGPQRSASNVSLSIGIKYNLY
ncbi:MAG: hypothetical protein Q8922_00015 [Bacteroidota bacterium]|nr:hypothetical protein [Bacteroidota bacterium]MDP4232418.1 hypothetical protein [Bacteroidota bacterium]MDP4241554.1 hypothetical protein [Bacteroidota bacterium]MDP4286298.1 hypothetical protein [Bacteroidota bacterium]